MLGSSTEGNLGKKQLQEDIDSENESKSIDTTPGSETRLTVMTVHTKQTPALHQLTIHVLLLRAT